LKLSVIIVNYNVQYFLEQCLLSVNKATQSISSEIFVVDNNSSDGSVEMVREKFPAVKLIANKDNPGFSKANNQAILQATGEYVLILNPDTVVAEDTFEICICFMKNHADAGALGVKMVDGKGVFLPESKRALPTPEVAFYKTFGLAALFPNSKKFGRYHLGFLSKDENHEVEILSGAFMFFRKSVLDTIGCFDETFFMYGEDVDLSYRVIKAGFKNYYMADTTILHYKGESTKKGSLNYVKVFYQAMIIFARKHFAANRASAFSLLINMAVVFRAILTVFINLLSSSYLVLVDMLLSFAGLYYIILFWANNIKNTPTYYPVTFLTIVVPCYILIWIGSSYLSSSYEKPFRVSHIFRGILLGTILISALYGFLPDGWRFSRAIILFGAIWTGVVMLFNRLLHNVLQHQKLSFENTDSHLTLLVGNNTEQERAKVILQTVSPENEVLCCVSAHENVEELKKQTTLFKINEVVFCAADTSYKNIIAQILALGNSLDYKILNPNSTSLIGSNSKNSAGDLYAEDINLNLSKKIALRKKRLLDIFLCLLLIPAFLLLLFLVKNFGKFLANWGDVFVGEKTWVGYLFADDNSVKNLPKIPTAIIRVADDTGLQNITATDARKLNVLYAKHYTLSQDIILFTKCFRQLGQ
jgi:GT2 family glycosyltransferase